jgi:hypothetical protein
MSPEREMAELRAELKRRDALASVSWKRVGINERDETVIDEVPYRGGHLVRVWNVDGAFAVCWVPR